MTEEQLHRAVVDYIRLQYPNARIRSDYSGVKLHPSTGRKMAAINPHRGFPDLTIWEKRGYFVGLAIELKTDGTRLTKKTGEPATEHIKEQGEWLLHLESLGWYSRFGIGFEHAKAIIDSYMNLQP